MSKYYRVKTLMLKGQKGDTGCDISNVQMNDDYTLTVTLENGMHFNTSSIRGEKGERGACIRSAELRDDYSLLFTLDNGETIETTAILGKEFENIRKLEASASSASKIAISASTSASASAQSASQASISASKSASNASTSASVSAQSATNASQSATNAQESASNASTSADTATSKATEASASATKAKECEMNAKLSETNASNSAKEAEASAVNAKASETKAEEYANNLQNSTEAISQLKEDLVANSKEDAKTKRSLSALWALNNGISYRFETDSEKAYQKEVPSGAKLGAVNKIGGRTIVYNQLFTEEATTVSNGITATYADGIMTLNGTATQNWINFSQMTSAMNVIGKFYIKMTMIKNDDKLSFYYGWLNRDMGAGTISSGSTSVIYNQSEEEIKKYDNTGIADFGVGAVFNDVKFQIIIVNLTKMFGEGNEPSTVEEFEAMFPNSYYPYNEGTLMNMSVNEVEEVGKNKFKCEHFSCIGIDGINNLTLSNSYGTLINSTEPSNSVTVTQSKIAQENIPTSYYNGYFCVSFKPLILNKDYVFSFDVMPSNKLITDCKILISLNGVESFNSAVTQDLQVGKRTRLYFNLTASNKKVMYFEIRNSGISGIFENFQLEKGSVNTAFSPYHENSYPIPQAILELDGYGASGNYVDFAKKEYHKGDEIIDISDIIEDTFQEPINVESGGSLTFKNTNGDGYQVAVPSDIQYVVSLSEVNS